MGTRFIILLAFLSLACNAQPPKVVVLEDKAGWRLLVDGKPMMVNGMNWDYFPIGTNYSYILWNEPHDFIKEALDYEMDLLKNMGVNAIRVYTGIPKYWIEYIYDHFGIYTMLNHSFGRYGLTLDGSWVGNTDYSDPRVKAILLREVTEMVQEFKDTRGLLIYLLGNENNYGLIWDGAETEDIPIADRQSTIRAREMYKLFNEAAVVMKKIDSSRPIAMANGDLLFLDIIAEELPDMDIFGSNVYRGVTFTDLYDRVKAEYNKPVLLSEFGVDAFNARTKEEDQFCQAYYKHGNWREIYAQAAGLGKAENSIGGFTFQFSDGWWKYGQEFDLDVHNTNASWSNGGYECDYVSGENNMNEEWFGIAAKGQTDQSGFYKLHPRAAYYVLKKVHQFDPYAEGVTISKLDEYFASISLTDAYIRARGDQSELQSEPNQQ
jgi:hypothetical protein